MIKYLIAVLFFTALLLAPLAASSNSQINAVGNTLKIASAQTPKVYSQFADSDFSARTQSKRKAENLSNTPDRTQVNFGLVAVALFCFVMRANRGRV